MLPEHWQVVPQLEQVAMRPQHPPVACAPGQAALWPLNTVVAPAASPPTFSNAQLDWGKSGSEKNSFYTGSYLCISPAGTRG